jgi:hypothetical protein
MGSSRAFWRLPGVHDPESRGGDPINHQAGPASEPRASSLASVWPFELRASSRSTRRCSSLMPPFLIAIERSLTRLGTAHVEGDWPPRWPCSSPLLSWGERFRIQRRCSAVPEITRVSSHPLTELEWSGAMREDDELGRRCAPTRREHERSLQKDTGSNRCHHCPDPSHPFPHSTPRAISAGLHVLI